MTAVGRVDGAVTKGRKGPLSSAVGQPAVNLSFSFRTPSTSSTGKWNNRGKGELEFFFLGLRPSTVVIHFPLGLDMRALLNDFLPGDNIFNNIARKKEIV